MMFASFISKHFLQVIFFVFISLHSYSQFCGAIHIVQNDTSICSGNPFALSVHLPQGENTVLSAGNTFEYSFDVPPAGWMNSIGGWSVGNAPFGDQVNGGPPEFDYNTYWPPGVPDHPDGNDLYLRRQINLADYNLSTIRWYIGVDNGFTLYVNGHRIDSSYDEGYTYRWEYSGIIPAGLLTQGNNIIALALSDNGGATAFDIMITGEPLQNNSGIDILWSTGDTTAGIFVTPAQTTEYYVTVTSGTDVCHDTVEVNVRFPSTHLINVAICEGENYAGYTSAGIYVDTLTGVNGCDSIRTIRLAIKPKYSSTINRSICQGGSFEGYTLPGTYIDTLTSTGGCDSIRTIHLTVQTIKQPYLGADTVICPGEFIDLYPGSFTTYQWQDGSTQKHFTVKHTGVYSVMVTDNCISAMDEIAIVETDCSIYFPSAFTPNNDGKNDLFKILNAYNLREYHLSVYNRWGQKVFDSQNYNRGWDGTFNGQLQASATFIWYCEFSRPGNASKTMMKGLVTLIK